MTRTPFEDDLAARLGRAADHADASHLSGLRATHLGDTQARRRRRSPVAMAAVAALIAIVGLSVALVVREGGTRVSTTDGDGLPTIASADEGTSSNDITVTIVLDTWLAQFWFGGDGPLVLVELGTGSDGVLARFEGHTVGPIELSIPAVADHDELTVMLRVPIRGADDNDLVAEIALPAGDQTITLTAEGKFVRGVFATDTDAMMIFDDGFDGIVVVDLDNRVATRMVIDGRAGDQPYRLSLTGGSLVAGWSQISVTPLSDLAPRLLAEATIFVPSPHDGTVWLIDYPGGRIGEGTPTYRLMTVDGETLVEQEGIDGAFPVIGYSDGLVLDTSQGLLLWNPDEPAPVPIGESAHAFISDSTLNQLAWCQAECNELHLTNTATLGDRVVRPTASFSGFEARSARFSPSGEILAAVVLEAAATASDPEAGQIALIDTASGRILRTTEADLPRSMSLSWRADSSELFFSGRSWGGSSTVIGRYTAAGDLETVVLPFGSVLGNVVVDAEEIDRGVVDLQPAEQCPATRIHPSRRIAACSFGF